MFCTQCGHELPDDARFCSNCGAPVGGGAGPDIDTTTAAIDIGAFDDTEHVEDVPELSEGTGMLVVVRGPNAGSRFLLDRDTTTIGRHPDSHIFLDDVTVSRRHAEVKRAEGTMSVTDLGSLNGTYVNGERCESQLLASGDEVQIGRFKLLFVGAGHRP
ncbi:MAG: zinc-ribbon and FHA domain-containing protein [Actinobacteria bacterium]|nr:zinc-ribbon and FHA domain-containing protein [Actinomycetota bacterium]